MRPTTVVIPETEQRLAEALATLKAVARVLHADEGSFDGGYLLARVQYAVGLLSGEEPSACNCDECMAWRVDDGWICDRCGEWSPDDSDDCVTDNVGARDAASASQRSRCSGTRPDDA